MDNIINTLQSGGSFGRVENPAIPAEAGNSSLILMGSCLHRGYETSVYRGAPQ